MYILIVDDEKSILKVVGDFLKDCEHKVVCAEDGAGALHILEEREEIDLIISDIRMPKLDGIRLLQAVRVRFPGIPVILMTGHGDESVAIAALEQGAQYYLKKPIKFAQLMDCIDQVETRHRLESQVADDYLGADKSGDTERRTPAERTSNALFLDRPAHFLLVDGEEDPRQFATVALEDMGYRVEVAATGEQGLKRFAEGIFDVVISEVDLPDMDGIEMVRSMRTSDPTLVPLILTSREDQETAVLAMDAGARGFLRKPFDPDELKERAGRAVQERRQLADTRLLLGDLIQVRADLRQKVVERERYLHHLIDAAPFAILSTDRKGQILTFNKKAEEMYRYSEEEILGKSFTLLEDRPGEKQRESDSIEGAAVEKANHVRKDGERVPVLTQNQYIFDSKKQPVACLYVIEDLTHREEMEAQLMYAERLSMLGQLAPRIAHEFKTPLQMIMSYAELALDELKGQDQETVEEYIELVLPSVERMISLVEQMSNLGKPSQSKEEEIDLAAELEGALDALRPLGVVKYCEIDIDFAPGLPPIYGDSGQIEQVFRNLIVNAAQAMEQSDEKILRLSLQVSAGGRKVEACVTDTGPGIAPEDIDQIFQPFFTTKTKDNGKGLKGTGLGLVIVKTVLDRHKASVQVESEVGKGTSFKLSFPALVK